MPPLLDPRDDEVGLLLDDVRNRKVHAVGWRPVNPERVRADRLDAKRPAKRERVSNCTRFLPPRDERYLAEMRERRRKLFDAFGMNTVVVGNQDFRHRNL